MAPDRDFLQRWIQEVPKAELHVHLEGSIDLPTLLEIDPSLPPAEAADAFRYRDFNGFLASFAFVAKRLRDASHYALAARRLFERMASQNVGYAEVILSAGVVLWKQQDFHAIFDAVTAEASRAPFPVAWNLDAVRQWGAEKAMEVVEHVASRTRDGAVSFGLGGDEAGGPARNFVKVFERARRLGLRLTCHAGETTGPSSVWEALECGAERIGHGIRSIDDPVLVRHLADHQVPLEISITSNVRTGAVSELAAHPVRRLFDAGVPIVLNTDDPGLFETDLITEYEIAAREFRFSQSELEALVDNGFRFGFCSGPR